MTHNLQAELDIFDYSISKLQYIVTQERQINTDIRIVFYYFNLIIMENVESMDKAHIPYGPHVKNLPEHISTSGRFATWVAWILSGSRQLQKDPEITGEYVLEEDQI